ncbi:efflux RND transporter periplasmic adaptor subunit [Nibricoccus sp. IMCC34717]|uniref:efflux RND transporter periplasmic adaptor subunit n=1 Tax=Nibricoccus sp. IMCC34717 TaxID=3034021 RepID=UPI00384F6301
MPSKSFPWAKVLLLALVLAGVAYSFFAYKGRQRTAPEVSTVRLSRGEIVQAVTATGVLQAPVSVDVSSQISGQISEVLVDYNSIVKKGDILARIDPATYDSRLRQTRAQLANAEATHRLARLNTERIRELHQKNLVSQQERDAAEAQLTQAEAGLKIQQANVANAEVDLSRCTIYAPIDGIVLDRQCDAGKTVAASFNAPTLFTLVTDLKALQISADVSEADIGSVALNQEVTFTVDAYPQRPFTGRVTQIRNVPKTQQSVVVYATIIEVRNDELKLKPGMTANVSIIIAKRTDVLRVPNAALRARIADEYKPALPAQPLASSVSDGQGSSASPQPPGQPVSNPQLHNREHGQGRGQGGERQSQHRTVYRLVSPVPDLKLEPVRAKIGITDGTVSEVLEGLNENDVLVSGVFVADSGANTPASNPFAPSTPGPGGGGGRRF